MKTKLIKVDDIYTLMDGDKMIASSDSDFQTDYDVMKLSKQNCDEIFGVVDMDKICDEYFINEYSWNGKNILPYKDSDLEAIKNDFIHGFNKAIELNKDKLFTVDDMKKAIAFGWDYEGLSKEEMIERYNFNLEYDNSYAEDIDKFIQSLQQPKEIEVEIRCYIGNGDKESDSFKDPLVTNTGIPKLDENGCLILRKK